ncbi:MAG TPA: polysaccharide deacetylase family protein [Usitatibacter sp.]|jgi:peptidoglycan/xylan/chitin deacetylase (PgdA/CDA1 family)|nr:polysaccharide deacetylase family protein [Usitatibacter sp.]
MSAITVLMYHTVADSVDARSGADPHYAVTRHRFLQHVRCIGARGMKPASVRSILDAPDASARVALTFDDGHESNARAAEWIALAGGSADFFVNPSNVGRPGFLDWPTLRAMAQAGHSIQSHGDTHRYLDGLAEGEVRAELRDSKARIEDGVGAPVTLFAPPGGRLAPRITEIAREAGYTALCCSRDGLWDAAGPPWRIPRLAVTAGVELARFQRWIDQDEWELARMRTRHAVLATAKRLLGNHRYDELRRALLAPAQPPHPH